MGSAIGLPDVYDSAALRRLARGSKSVHQARRLLALAEIYDGGKPTKNKPFSSASLRLRYRRVASVTVRSQLQPTASAHHTV